MADSTPTAQEVRALADQIMGEGKFRFVSSKAFKLTVDQYEQIANALRAYALLLEQHGARAEGEER